MATGLDEERFETDIVEYLTKHAGYTQATTNDYEPNLGLNVNELFAFINDTQIIQWDTLIKRHGGDKEKAQHKFIQRLVSNLDQRGTIDVLHRGVEDQGVKIQLAYSRPTSSLNATILDLYNKNRLTVTRQLHYSSRHSGSLDLGLFINGIPVATAELKSPINGQDVTDAIAQYKKDRFEPGNPLLTKRAVVHFAVDPDLVYITTHLAGEATEFIPFNKGSNPGELSCGKGNPHNPNGYATSYIWETIWSFDNWLDILLRFVQEIDVESDKKRTCRVIFPRFHQWDVVKNLESDTILNGAGKSYLIQHSAGSGKSNTIAWLAYRLSVLHNNDDQKIFEKVILVTDRRALDEQLANTVKGFENVIGTLVTVQGKSGSKSKELADALTGQAKIITVTLETFPFVIEKIENSQLSINNYAIIVDEAHSSQTGEAAFALKRTLGVGSHQENTEDSQESNEEYEMDSEDVLTSILSHRGKQPNLSFFAFTGTPKERTLEIFGTLDAYSEVKKPYHLYTMRQAIEEGFILDVLKNYTTYKVYFKLAAGSELVAIEKVEVHKTSSVLKRYVKTHPHLIQEKAAIIVEHFRTHTSKKLNGRAKAMVVTDSRVSAVKYKRAIDHHLTENGYNDIRALVAFSGSIDEETESSLNGFPESQTAKRFKGEPPFSPGDYQVLIVAEKFQTGFDEPYLHTMFVDKKLIGLNAVQTLSRLNRIAPGKDDTFVLDFCNDAEDIRQAFQRYYEAVIIEPTDANILYDLRSRMFAAGILKVDEINSASDAYFAAEPAKRSLKVIYANIDLACERYATLDEDTQNEFRDALDQFIRIYSFMSQVISYTDELLERLYVYAKALAACLPNRVTGHLDLGKDVVLTHLRIEPQGKAEISLDPNVLEVYKVFAGDGQGGIWEDKKEPLAIVIEAINEKFGLDLDERDRLEGEKLKLTLLEDKELQTFANNNSMEHYSLEFTGKFKEAILSQEERNQRLYNLLLSKPELAAIIENAMMQETYDEFRGI